MREQTDAQQRAGGEIERPLGLLRDLVEQRLRRPRRSVDDLERRVDGRVHALDRLALRRREDRAERLVPVDQSGECALERRGVDRRHDPRRERDVVGGAARRNLMQDPQRALTGRQRTRVAAGIRAIGRAGWRRGAADDRRELGERRRVEDGAERDVRAEPIVDRRDQARRQQRIAAAIEEVVVAADGRRAEQRLPRLRQPALGIRARRHEARLVVARTADSRQLVAIDLAGRRRRNRRDANDLGKRSPAEPVGDLHRAQHRLDARAVGARVVDDRALQEIGGARDVATHVPVGPIEADQERPLARRETDRQRLQRLLGRHRVVAARATGILQLEAAALTDAAPVAPAEARMRDRAPPAHRFGEGVLKCIGRRVSADAGTAEEPGDGRRGDEHAAALRLEQPVQDEGAARLRL